MLRSTLRRLAPAALALLALLAPPPAAARPGEEPPAAAPTPEEAYEARLKTALPQIGALFEAPASFAMSNKLKRTGIALYRSVLEFDPDNQKARRELGFDRRGTEWVPVESKQKKIDDLEDESGKKFGDYEERLGKAQTAAARILSELGDLASKADLGDRALLHWKKAILWDDQNEAANKGMGHVRVDGKWFSQRAINHKEFLKVYKSTLAEAQKLPVAVVSADDTSGIAEAAGVPVIRYKTANFRIESNLPLNDVRETLIWLERARHFYLKLFDIQERHLDYSGDPMVFIIVTSPEQKDKLVDACGHIPQEQKAFKKRFSAIAVSDRLTLAYHDGAEGAQRQSIHTATHAMVRATLGNHAPWLSEALANAVSAAVRNADLVVCFSGDGSTGGIHLENIGLETAPKVLRELVLAKKDTPIAEFVKLPSDGMTAQQIAKSWSIVMFLLQRDRLQAREYFSAAGQGTGGDSSKEDRVLKEFFEDFPRWEVLDAEWRDWAVDVYKDR